MLLLAIGLYQVPVLVQYLWKKERRAALFPELRFSALVLLSAGVLYLFLQQGVYAHPELQGSYLDQLRLLNDSLVTTLSRHAEECIKNTLNYFQMGMEVAQLHKGTRPDIAAQLGGAIALGFVVLGMFQPRKGREGLLGIFLVCFVGLLLIWPLVQGFRYLLPVFPALFIYLLRGLDAVKPARRAAQIALWALIPLLWYGEYDRGFKGLKDLSMQNDYGSPEFSNNQEAFQFVRTQIPDTVRLAYHHPLILGLYAERKSMCWQASPPEAMQREFRNFKVDYLLVNNWLSQSDPALEQYLQFYKASLDTVWHNERNCLYRLH